MIHSVPVTPRVSVTLDRVPQRRRRSAEPADELEGDFEKIMAQDKGQCGMRVVCELEARAASGDELSDFGRLIVSLFGSVLKDSHCQTGHGRLSVGCQGNLCTARVATTEILTGLGQDDEDCDKAVVEVVCAAAGSVPEGQPTIGEGECMLWNAHWRVTFIFEPCNFCVSLLSDPC